MDDLTAEFIEIVEVDLLDDKCSHMTRLCLMTGPPEGVDYYEPAFLEVMKKAMAKWPEVELHEDWAGLLAEVENVE